MYFVEIDTSLPHQGRYNMYYIKKFLKEKHLDVFHAYKPACPQTGDEDKCVMAILLSTDGSLLLQLWGPK